MLQTQFHFIVLILIFWKVITYTVPSFKICHITTSYKCRQQLILKTYAIPSQRVSQIEDDGYTLSQGKRSFVVNILKSKLRFVLPKKNPGTLILIRHGETTLNYNKTYTGWMDPDLNDRGILEIEHAARLLLERGYIVDTVYTSRLKRAIRSSWIILQEINQIFRPVFKSWRLNERMYGALEGTSKLESAKIMGESTVQDFRIGLTGRPPEMSPNHPQWHGNERKYADLDSKEIPVTESLQDTMERTIPLWETRIKLDLLEGKTVMVVAHANSLRGILKHIDNLSPDEIKKVGIPNGIPLVYKFDSNMKPIPMKAAVAPLTGEFLEKKGLLRAALIKESALTSNIPGYDQENDKSSQVSEHYDKLTMSSDNDPRISGLTKLNLARGFYNTTNDDVVDEVPYHSLETTSIPQTNTIKKLQQIDGPIVVIIRHGKTEYNKLGIFTGWNDAPLAKEGIEEAKKAGELLKIHGIEFDVVYTSWLSRAIYTAWIVLDQLDCLWLPIMKTWRLNERMYGSLTGLSKKMIAETYGDDKFRRWRRGYDVRPPAISSFSSIYPGNDERYVKYVRDIRYSVFESIIRSVATKSITLHRKFPKTESLKDCMSRTIPYFKNVIEPESIAKGKNVLIASSENAIRGLLMHLCEIPIEKIHELEIPTGLPLVYDVNRKCIHLLDDGTGEDLLSKYNFGLSPEYLFRPCKYD